MTRPTAPPTVRIYDYLVVLLLFALSFGVLGLAQRTVGVTRDEGIYFNAADSYWHWFSELADSLSAGQPKRVLSERIISRYWRTNDEHPVLLKTLFGLSHRYFHETDRLGLTKLSGQHARPGATGPLSAISAYRLPGWCVTALAVALIYLFGLRIHSRIAGLTAALLYITMPRLFFHGQLACFDSGIATAWLFVVYAYFRALSRARWAIIAGIAFGLALATKHNAWFIPALLIVHYLIVVWPDISLRPLILPRVPFVMVTMAVLGPLIFWAHWPWLWFDTMQHLNKYFAFHLHHVNYNMEYLGTNYNAPPFPISYPFVMTAFTVPTVTLVLMLAGCGVYLHVPLRSVVSRWFGKRPPRHDDPFRYPARRCWLRPGKGLNPRVGTLLLLNAAFPLLLIALPWTPIFGGTKHWLPAYPFVALFAGVAIAQLVTALGRRGRIWRTAAPTLALLTAAPGAANIWTTHPFGLSQYNALAGGPAGAADKGLNRQFWGYSPRQLLPWLNDVVEDDGRVYFHDVIGYAHRAYIEDGLLRPDIAYSGMELPGIRSSSVALVIHELHFNKYDYWIWSEYGSPIPAKVLQLDGVPLVTAYVRNPQPTTKELP